LDDLLGGAPSRVIYRIGLLVYAGLCIASLVGLLDAFLLGRLGPLALAAYGFTLTAFGILFGLSAALGTGVRTAVAQCLGRGDRDAAARTISAACLLAVPLFIAFGLLGIAYDEAVYRFAGAGGDDVARAESFMRPIWVVSPCVALTMVAMSALHSCGDVKPATKLIVINLPVNLLVAPVLIFGLGPVPSLGLFGAGLAASLAWLISASVGMFFLVQRSLLRRPEGGALAQLLRPVVQVALPTAFGQLTVMLSLSLLIGIVARLGTPATAALAVFMRITDFMLMGVNSLAVGVQVVASVAIGARNQERVRAVVTTGIAMSCIWGLGCAALFTLAANPIAQLLAGDAQVSARLAELLRLGSLNFPFFAAFVAACAGLNSVTRSRDALVLALIGSFAILIPTVQLFTGAWGFSAFGPGLVVARVACVLVAAAWLRHVRLVDLRSVRLGLA
jgi:putative MATE family efflux protein